ncbi:MAG: protoporphyrinogen oxidase [Prolixibacteraceae bacterium]|nr:protoporphyrinogen oxidase [Prolixibacteraceae bacterium]MBN2774655.1 protoporphyrinogen oxidase [Prolixibacteraceae bacterium]
MNNTKKIAIIGGGLTGLTTAYYLKKSGFDIHVFERNNRVGGVIKTNQKKGFTFESGPNTGVLSQPEAVELIEDLKDDCHLEIADDAAKARWIWKAGKWESLPSGLVGGITTPLFTFSDKLRLLGEPFRKKGSNPNESLADLVLRRMGKSFLDYAVDPFILGIYSGDPKKLITKYALPKLYNLEQNYGSFIKGSIKKARIPKTEREKKATREIFSVSGGLENLIKALEKNIGSENITLNCKDLSVQKETEKTYKIGNENFDYVVSTTGAYSLDKIFSFADPEKLKHIGKLVYAKVIQVSLGFNNWKGIPLKAFGGLVPSKENRDVLGILFLSSFLKNKAPENGVLLSVFLGGVRHPEIVGLSDREIEFIVKREVSEMMGLTEFNPDMMEIFRYQHAIPQYGIESEEKLNSIELLEKEHPGIILAGNIRDGIGMADRIKQGKTIAEQIQSKN